MSNKDRTSVFVELTIKAEAKLCPAQEPPPKSLYLIRVTGGAALRIQEFDPLVDPWAIATHVMRDLVELIRDEAARNPSFASEVERIGLKIEDGGAGGSEGCDRGPHAARALADSRDADGLD